MQGCLHTTHVMLVYNAYARGLLSTSCSAYAIRLMSVRCRLTNIGNTSLVLDDITLDYWFNGPADSSVSVDQFRPVCSDTTIGDLSNVLCCAVLCCAVLCCAVLCCAVLCCAVLCWQAGLHAVLRYTVPCCASSNSDRSRSGYSHDSIPIVSLRLHRVVGGARSAGINPEIMLQAVKRC